ncbi:acyl-CoA thioesterase [Phycisphaerales bacterium AB-hyl4]|uniref:Acyl-CoA thioesterase n=1 Tax=Natronomicrosphaera hydrolytica TaxID=3242702 RepID=A0ABV4U5L3_9BACT
MIDPATLRTDAGDPLPLDVPRPFVQLVTVTDADCDRQRHVNNAVYPRWMDDAAYAHSCAVGYDWARYQEMGASFVVRRHEIDYLGEALAGDRLVVATWPKAMAKFNAERRHQVLRLSDGVVMVRAMTRWVFMDIARRRPRRIPAEMIEAFQQSVDTGSDHI